MRTNIILTLLFSFLALSSSAQEKLMKFKDLDTCTIYGVFDPGYESTFEEARTFDGGADMTEDNGFPEGASAFYYHDSSNFYGNPDKSEVYRIYIYINRGHLDLSKTIPNKFPIEPDSFPNVQEILISCPELYFYKEVTKFKNLQRLKIVQGRTLELNSNQLSLRLPDEYGQLNHLKELTVSGPYVSFPESMYNLPIEKIRIEDSYFIDYNLLNFKHLKTLEVPYYINSYLLYASINNIIVGEDESVDLDKFGSWYADDFNGKPKKIFNPRKFRTSFNKAKKTTGTQPFEFHYKDGNICMQGSLTDGKLDGEWKIFDYNGRLMEKREYKMGIPAGKWETYYPQFHGSDKIKENAKVSCTIEFKDYENGKLTVHYADKGFYFYYDYKFIYMGWQYIRREPIKD